MISDGRKIKSSFNMFKFILNLPIANILILQRHNGSSDLLFNRVSDDLCQDFCLIFFFLVMKNYFIIKYNLYFKRVSKKYKLWVQHMELTCSLFPYKIYSTKCAPVLERIYSFFSLT